MVYSLKEENSGAKKKGKKERKIEQRASSCLISRKNVLLYHFILFKLCILVQSQKFSPAAAAKTPSLSTSLSLSLSLSCSWGKFA